MGDRILFINFNETIVLGVLERIIESTAINLERMFHIGNSKLSSKAVSPSKYVFMYYLDAINLPLSTQDGTTIDADLLDSLAEYEYQSLLMLGRTSNSAHDFRLQNLNIRRHLYYTHLAFWLNYLRSNKINKILFFEIPHAGFDYIIYLLAKKLNINTIVFSHCQIPDTIFISDNILNLYDDIEGSYQRILKKTKKITFSARAQKEFNLRCSEQIPYYMLRPAEKSLSKYKRYLKVLTMNPITVAYDRFCIYYKRRKFIRSELLLPAKKAFSEVNLNEKYIYFALHLQPECTTLPMGGRYVDQYLAIKLLMKHLPEGMKLYVKEHPTMYTHHDPSGRFKEFYELICNLPNVKMVKPNVSTFALIQSSQAVATITGTVGWEALFREKSIFVFGNIFYKYCHGAYSIYSEADMIDAMHKIFVLKIKPDLNKVKLYFEAIEECSFRGTSYGEPLKISEKSLEENVEFVFNLVLNLIKYDFKLSTKLKKITTDDVVCEDFF